MNVKYFFVKDFKEFLRFPTEILNKDSVKNNPKLRDLIKSALEKNDKQSIERAYSELLPSVGKSFHGNIKIFYEGSIFCATDIAGLKLDFNFGLRLEVPTGNFFVKISDFDSGTIFFAENVSDVRLIASDFYYIHWQIEVYRGGRKIFHHIFEPKNLPVLIVCSSTALGDTLAFLPHIREFQRKHQCKIFLWVREYLRELVKNFYPEIEQVEQPSLNYYATFYSAPIMGELLSLPADTRTIPLEKIGAMILGLKNLPPLPKFSPTKKREIAEPYVCISVQASGVQKGWHYPGGWDIVVDYLKNIGYRVLCIDKNAEESADGYTNKIPVGAEDFTGNIPLIERANMLYHAEFFIGLSSGLAWLAHYVGCEVILISGFTQDWNEFYTPYRVANRFVCNGCYNDFTEPPTAKKFCTRYSGTERELECQKKISPRQVIAAIDKLLQ